jgi:predicted RND superfamily exporter protein
MTGLPVAEDTFGVEMFKQMAISAPLAMIVIFSLMYLFFHSFMMILSPMIVAVIAVICAMGLLVLTGNTVHIMSSMIPIFLIPISVLDSIHILSEFFDRARENGGSREKIMARVMDELSSPMLFTSLTTMAGFGSMALTPIPPVQVFGIFVALGVFLAWLMTVTFIPAYTMVLSDNAIQRMVGGGEKKGNPWFPLVLEKMGQVSFHRAGTIIVITVILIVFSVYGIRRIEVNDNPVKWFGKNHSIRVSDRVLNEHFGGTYMAYMILEAKDSKETLQNEIDRTVEGLSAFREEFFDLPYMDEAVKKVKELVQETGRRHLDRGDYSLKSYYKEIDDTLDLVLDEARGETYDTWYEIRAFVDEQTLNAQVFKNPEMLAYMEKLEDAVKSSGVVGKTNSVATLVKKVYMELMGGGEEHFRVPDSIAAVGQSLLSFQNSHKPNDLWHLVTPDYTKSNIWVQLKSGDNKDMTKAVRIAGDFLRNNPPPFPIELKWSGLTYLNVIWQEKMVWGMLNSFAGSFIIVLIMMIFLFRSLITGLLSMVPLSVTIMFIYALIGIGGKSYDMPVAVLSSMTLGLSIDFAIHFLERSKNVFQRLSNFKDTMFFMFDEPARAIARNAIVIALGFLPLLAAPLIPYKTVGFFMAGIMATSSVATLFILPALAKVFQRFIYKKAKKVSVVCNCIFCSTLSAFLILGVAYAMHQYSILRWSHATWIAALGVLASMTLCYATSRREICRMARETKKEDK